MRMPGGTRTLRTAVLALGTAAAACALAQSLHYKVLHAFGEGILPDGTVPLDAPTIGPDGALYGSASMGPGYGNTAGAIWRLGRNGNYGLLHEFLPDAGGGGGPRGPLVVGPDEWLYGTATGMDVACGAVFRVDVLSRFHVVHQFAPDEMCTPQGGVTFGADGTIYGTAGTTGGHRRNEAGAVFRLAPDGHGLQALHTFDAPDAEGAGPNAGVILGADGALYGTTINAGPHGAGTLFRLGLDGSFSVLHAFRAGTEGRPLQASGARLLLGRDGAIYGTLGLEGPHRCGSIYRLDKKGRFTLLHVFKDTGAAGCSPSGGLVQAKDGTFYGTTQSGGPAGAAGRGTVFSMTADGQVALVHAFEASGQGQAPMGGVTLAAHGTLAGTTSEGGTGEGDQGGGVAWRLVQRSAEGVRASDLNPD
jgi:uncharacterized repeat protein (TIGR03803 family)